MHLLDHVKQRLRKNPTEADRRFLERPLIKKMLVGETASMKEIRDFILSFLAEHETLTICANCSRFPAPRNKVACCDSCPLHDLEVGCTLRTTACLMWACGTIYERLKQRGAREEFGAIANAFGGLDRMRGSYRIPDDEEIRLEEHGWGRYGVRAKPVNGEIQDLQEKIWGAEDEKEARERHSAFYREHKREETG
jgi:hypothetical protein